MDLNDDDARAKLLHQLLDNALAGTTNQICSAIDPSKLAIRELPPGTWAQIYLLYQSFCLANDLECAGQTTFYSATMPWRKALKFRPASKHSLCTTCDRLKSSMRHSKDFLQHAKAADELLGHLKLTWLNRKAYWHAREMSRAHQETLRVIFDGFDKSKPVVPRWAHGQLPKNPIFERLSRTNIAISATLCHGYGAIIYMAEEGCMAGGSFVSLRWIWRVEVFLVGWTLLWICYLMNLLSHFTASASNPRLGVLASLHRSLQTRRSQGWPSISADAVVPAW